MFEVKTHTLAQTHHWRWRQSDNICVRISHSRNWTGEQLLLLPLLSLLDSRTVEWWRCCASAVATFSIRFRSLPIFHAHIYYISFPNLSYRKRILICLKKMLYMVVMRCAYTSSLGTCIAWDAEVAVVTAAATTTTAHSFKQPLSYRSMAISDLVAATAVVTMMVVTCIIVRCIRLHSHT